MTFYGLEYLILLTSLLKRSRSLKYISVLQGAYSIEQPSLEKTKGTSVIIKESIHLAETKWIHVTEASILASY